MAVRWCVLLLVGCATVAQAGDTLTIPLLSNERFPAQPSAKQAVVRLPADRSYARLLLLLCPVQEPSAVEWSASPQPTSDVVRIELAQQVTEVRLLSLEGRQREVPIRTDRTIAELDCSQLAPGVYFVVATTGAGRVTVPIVVVR